MPLAHICSGKPVTLQNTLPVIVKQGVLFGWGVGAAGGILAQFAGAEKAHEMRTEMEADKQLTRADNYSYHGSILGAIITPVILFKRAPVKTLAMAGYGLGSSAGGGVHLLESLKELAVSAVSAGPEGPAVSALS
ncbi:hypothetical protein FRC09_012233 [Ceratobasidium sp. 395]|nr:hypothetical protein FRC09_012233 [Ceratobasidium sp. 395]